jgi:hypothetical protein
MIAGHSIPGALRSGRVRMWGRSRELFIATAECLAPGEAGIHDDP